MVLSDTDTVNTTLPNTSVMLDYWGTTLSDVSEPVSAGNPICPSPSAALQSLWVPIDEDVVRTVRVKHDAAAGPDKIRARD